jgi:hypothetical protein
MLWEHKELPKRTGRESLLIIGRTAGETAWKRLGDSNLITDCTEIWLWMDDTDMREALRGEGPKAMNHI